MPVLIHYALADGQIQQIYEATSQEFLDWQYRDVAMAGALTLPQGLDMAPSTVMERYVVDLDTLTIIPKPVGVLTAAPNPFPADGLTSCVVTLTPFVPCSLRIGTEVVALTAQDPTLDFKADLEQVFTITLILQAAIWADSLRVEAI
jgi:hypothetical protein